MESLRFRMCESKGGYDQPYAARMVGRTPSVNSYYKCPFCRRYHVSRQEQKGKTPDTLYRSSSLKVLEAKFQGLLAAGVPQGNIIKKRLSGDYFIMVK